MIERAEAARRGDPVAAFLERRAQRQRGMANGIEEAPADAERREALRRELEQIEKELGDLSND